MTARDLDEYSDEPLNPMEIRKARRMLEESERAHWLWSKMVSVVILAGTIAGLAAALKTWWTK